MPTKNLRKIEPAPAPAAEKYESNLIDMSNNSDEAPLSVEPAGNADVSKDFLRGILHQAASEDNETRDSVLDAEDDQ